MKTTESKLNAVLPKRLIRKLKSVLSLRGQSITDWVRKCAERETGQ